jgi:hypothetical protein
VAIRFDQFQPNADDDVLGGCLLPVQYNPIHRGHYAWDSERRLLTAVLEDAIRCYLTNRSASSKAQVDQFEEVQAWFNDRGAGYGAQGLFAYETICEALGIEPGVLRQRLSSISPAKVRSRCQRHPGPKPGVVGKDRKRAAEAGR